MLKLLPFLFLLSSPSYAREPQPTCGGDGESRMEACQILTGILDTLLYSVPTLVLYSAQVTVERGYVATFFSTDETDEASQEDVDELNYLACVYGHKGKRCSDHTLAA